MDGDETKTSVEPPPSPSGGATEATAQLTGAPALNPILVEALRRPLELPEVSRDEYEVIGEHARGGIGRIVQARDRRTGRIVALKEMLAGNERSARRFAREALITANLMHPAIVPVYELGKWPTGEPFYAMKLVHGASLKTVIDACTTLDERLARLPNALSIAEALAYAHERRIIHRDLKPHNVLVGDLGETVVIDWGLAKILGEADDLEPIIVPDAVDVETVMGAVMGTPQYMPPEQARGAPADERSDVYQLGALLYHLIAGAAPYDSRGIKTSDLVKLVIDQPPVPLAEREPSTPPDLAAIVGKAMAREPAARYAHAGELAEDLRRFTTGQLVLAHRYDRRTLLARWLRRNRAPVLVGAVLAAALVAVAVFSVRRILSERDNAERQLALALYEKGLAAEVAQEWSNAAMYFAAARGHHDDAAYAWAAGIAETYAVVPRVRHLGHGATVNAAAFSPDGARVATVDEAGRVRVWSPGDGALVLERTVSPKALRAAAFSPDGRELAVAGDDGDIVRYSRDLAELGRLRGHAGRVWTLAYAPGGRLLASGGEDRTVRMWPLGDGAGAPRELRGHTQRVYAVAFSRDGARLASGSDDRKLWLWDVAAGTGAARGDHKAGGIRVVAWTPDDQRVATSGWDHEVRLWSRHDASPPEVWTDTNVVHGAAIVGGLGDGLLITAGELSAIHVWDASTHRLVTSIDAPGVIESVAASPDGRWLVTAGEGPPIVWDAAALQRIASRGHRAAVPSLAFTRDGKRFVSASNDQSIRLWDLATARELRRISTGTRQCADGVIALHDDDIASPCDDATIVRWGASGPARVLPTDEWMRITALSPDGALLAAGHIAGKLALVDVATWSIVRAEALHAHHIYGVQIAGDRLVTVSLDDHVRVWRLPSLERELDVRAGTDDGVLAAARSPDGATLVIGTQDGSLAVWDVRGNRWRARDLGERKLGRIWRVVFAPDGTRVYSAGEDGAVRIWDTRSWTSTVALAADEGPALAMLASPDGTTLVAGYKSGAIAVWDLATQRLRTRIGGRARGSCAALATHAWIDEGHRAIVEAACRAGPGEHLDALSARTHQRLDGIDVVWDWPTAGGS